MSGIPEINSEELTREHLPSPLRRSICELQNVTKLYTSCCRCFRLGLEAENVFENESGGTELDGKRGRGGTFRARFTRFQLEPLERR